MDKRGYEDKRLDPARLEDKSGRVNRPGVSKKRSEGKQPQASRPK